MSIRKPENCPLCDLLAEYCTSDHGNLEHSFALDAVNFA